MTTGLFDYGKEFVLDVVFGKTKTVPATWYIAMLRTLPTEDLTGSTIDEPWFNAGEVGEDPPEEPDGEPDPIEDVPTGYARVAVDNDAVTWMATEWGLKRNAIPIAFPTATQDWGLIVALAVVDAATGGNAIMWMELSTPLEVTMGNAPLVDDEMLVISASTPEDPADPSGYVED